MAKPNYEGAVYTAQFPDIRDGKTYFIFQLLNDKGFAVDPVFYRDVSLAGSVDIITTVINAYMERRKLQVLLEPSPIVPTPPFVKSVRLGSHHTFTGAETFYAGKPR